MPFISDDVCCYSHPRFDEAAKLFHKGGGKVNVVALITVHFGSPNLKDL